MDRDSLELSDTDVLCAESESLLDTLEELRATAHQLQVEARAAQDTAQLMRETSKRLLRKLAGSNQRTGARQEQLP